MKNLLIVVVLTAISVNLFAQVSNTGLMDTTSFTYQGKVSVEGYIDTYYGYDFNKPSTGERSYFVSMSRHNEANINLAYIDVKYSSSRLRGRFVPGFGSYINSNYAAETGSLKNIIEASAGIRLFQNRNIWLDAGVFGSPYTNESAISKDHLAYTRSFAPEYVPYYLSGIKLTIPLNSKLNLYLYGLNGWQQIIDKNQKKSLGTQLEFRPTDNLLINWDTYVGDESSVDLPDEGTRYFSDIYFIYSRNNFSATGCFYYGVQKRSSGDASWWQANLIGRYSFTDKISATARVEYFDDPKSVQITPVTDVDGFKTASSSLGLNLKLADNVLIRFEGRTFFSSVEVYLKDNTPSKTSNMLISNITLWF